MKVWIIYDSKYGHCKKLAKILEDLLEGDFDVSVGHAKKISPDDVLTESPEAILVGGPIHFGKPSRVISSWIKECFTLTQSLRFKIGKTFAFTTWRITAGYELIWQYLLQKYPFATNCFPRVLSMKINPKSKSLGLELNQVVYDLIDELRQFLL